MLSPSVLLVDAGSVQRSALTAQLEELGFAVVVAADTWQALDRLAGGGFRLVLLSTSPPGIDSYRILARLRESDRAPAAIMLTPAERPVDLERYFELGATDYLAEPFLPGAVKARIGACLARQEQREQRERDEQRELLLKLERDVQIARQIQEGFLPARLPQLPGWEITARFHPAREVAGDFYDVFTLTERRRVGFIIADVCDKGVGAALFMSLSRSLIRAFAQQHHTLSWMDVLSDDGDIPARAARGRQATPTIGASALRSAVVLTNAYINDNHAEMNMFVTLFFGVLDPTSGALLYVNAGHCPPVVVGAQGAKETLAITGPAVGLFPDASFELAEARLEPGDTIFCYTDGVTDARNSERAFFGKERVARLLALPAPSARELLDRFDTQLQAHIVGADQFDDITMLALRHER